MGWIELLKPVAAMIAFDTLFAVMTVLVKKALDGGLNPVVLIALRQLVGAAFLAPIAYFKERFVEKILAFRVQLLNCFCIMFSTWKLMLMICCYMHDPVLCMFI